jgi:hypothetical protein
VSDVTRGTEGQRWVWALTRCIACVQRGNGECVAGEQLPADPSMEPSRHAARDAEAQRGKGGGGNSEGMGGDAYSAQLQREGERRCTVGVGGGGSTGRGWRHLAGMCGSSSHWLVCLSCVGARGLKRGCSGTWRRMRGAKAAHGTRHMAPTHKRRKDMRISTVTNTRNSTITTNTIVKQQTDKKPTTTSSVEH